MLNLLVYECNILWNWTNGQYIIYNISYMAIYYVKYIYYIHNLNITIKKWIKIEKWYIIKIICLNKFI